MIDNLRFSGLGSFLQRMTLLVSLFALAGEHQLFGLPIGFGTNQTGIEYKKLSDDEIDVFYDSRAPREAYLHLDSIKKAKPILEGWFGVKRDERLQVVSSAVSANASFANFLTDNIELQTLGDGTRDLAWHELAHVIGYEHLDNLLGRPGALIHLAFMPSWWIEGVPEALTVSTGSAEQAGIERYQALSGDWLSFDSLHNVYRSSAARRAYATSGAFVAYLLRNRLSNDQFVQIHKDFYWNSMPWWWPWTLASFTYYMPLDAALEDALGQDSMELYLEYKEMAKKHWEKHSVGPFFSVRPGARMVFSSYWLSPSSFFGTVTGVDDEAGKKYAYKHRVDKETGWVTGFEKTNITYPKADGGFAIAFEGGQAVYLKSRRNIKSGRSTQTILVQDKPGGKLTQLGEVDQILDLKLTNDFILFFDRTPSGNRRCRVPRQPSSKSPKRLIQCSNPYSVPEGISPLGHSRPAKSSKNGLSEAVYFAKKIETLYGDRYEVFAWDGTAKPKPIAWLLGGKPMQIESSGDSLWVLSEDKTHRTLRKLDSNSGQCLGVARFDDHVTGFMFHDQESMILNLYAGSRFYRYWTKTDNLSLGPCKRVLSHVSPMTVAASGSAIDLKSAVAASDLWQTKADDTKLIEKVKQAESVGNQRYSGKSKSNTTDGPYEFGVKTAYAFPFLGGDDPQGLQLGFISLPLIDNLQNESLDLRILVGLESRYPQTQLVFQTTRFWPTWTVRAFRSQVFNGVFRKGRGTESSYLDEKGIELSGSLPFYLSSKTFFQLSPGLKVSEYKPYIGQYFAVGPLNETRLSAQLSQKFGSVTWSNSVATRHAIEELNPVFDYNVVAASSYIGFPVGFRRATLGFGVDGSRTRGKRTRDLREVYRPLKTFVPGTGSGFQSNSFLLAGEGSLFTGRYGNSQARAKANFTMPLVSNLDTLVWILYLDRIDFSAFLNHGGTWRGTEVPFENFVTAHGYNVDITIEKAEFGFHTGLGVGQVVEEDFQFYMNLGLNILF